MLLDASGNPASQPEVEVKERHSRVAKHLDDVLTPEDTVIFRCMTCETYLLPKELHTLRRQMRDKFGNGITEIIFQCPVCNPNPDLNNGKPVESDFARMSRVEYEYRRGFERANLVMPDTVRMVH